MWSKLQILYHLYQDMDHLRIFQVKQQTTIRSTKSLDELFANFIYKNEDELTKGEMEAVVDFVKFIKKAGIV